MSKTPRERFNEQINNLTSLVTQAYGTPCNNACIFHQTSQSHSLVDQLSIRGSAKVNSSFVRFQDQIRRDLGDPNMSDLETEDLHYMGDTATLLGIGGGTAQNKKMIASLSIDEWWEQQVHGHGNKRFTRKSIIKTAANKAGGAHADPNPDSTVDIFTLELGKERSQHFTTF